MQLLPRSFLTPLLLQWGSALETTPAAPRLAAVHLPRLDCFGGACVQGVGLSHDGTVLFVVRVSQHHSAAAPCEQRTVCCTGLVSTGCFPRAQADSSNQRIRAVQLDSAEVSTIAGAPSPKTPPKTRSAKIC